jgi:hypothetical protein
MPRDPSTPDAPFGSLTPIVDRYLQINRELIQHFDAFKNVNDATTWAVLKGQEAQALAILGAIASLHGAVASLIITLSSASKPPESPGPNSACDLH